MKKRPILFLVLILVFSLSAKGQTLPDPAVTNIQISGTATCLDSSETIVVSISNMGSIIDLSVTPLVVYLQVTNGNNTQLVYVDTMTSGLLQGNGSNVMFTNVNLYAGGCYSINTDSLKILNSNYTANVNDSLPTALLVCNSRPIGRDFNICQNDTIPAGQGLTMDCPLDSILIPFTLSNQGQVSNPTSCSPMGAAQFATAVLPSLPPGSVILSGRLVVTNLSSVSFNLPISQAPFTRFSLFSGSTPTTASNIYYNGTQGSSSATPFGSFEYNVPISATSLNNLFAQNLASINMGYWSTSSCTSASIAANVNGTTQAYLKIYYQQSSAVKWYEQPSGGVSIVASSVFNPLSTPNNIVNTSSVAGTYTFFGACEPDTNCRTAVDFNVAGVSISNITATNVSCSGGNDGSIQVSAAGSTAPISYTLLPISAFSSSGLFSNLGANVYTARVTTANNCSVDTNVVITEPAQLVMSTSVTNVLCKGDSTGSAIISFNGGTGVINVTLSPALGVQSSAGTFQSLPAGTYTATATDANACTATTVFTITEPASDVNITAINTSPASCNPGCDATMTVSASGGTGGLQYQILPNAGQIQVSNVFAGLCTGAYSVRASDANGCLADSSFLISNNNVPVFNNVVINNTICHGDSTGSFQLSVSGGTPPYNYSTIPNIGIVPWNNLPAGNFTVQVSDANSCVVSTSVTITQPAPLALNVQTKNTSCPQISDGEIMLSATGGTGAHAFSLNGGAMNATGVYTNLPAGANQISAMDANGCTTDSTIIISSNLIELRLAALIGETCIPGNDGTLSIYGFPADTNYLYSIDSVNWQQSGEFKNLNSGFYQAFLLDSASGCTDVRQEFVGYRNNLPLNQVVVKNERCTGQNDGEILFPTDSIVYSLYPSAGTITAKGISNIPPGIYTLEGQQPNGCKGEKVIEVSKADSIWIADINFSNSNVHCYGTANITAQGGAGIFNYSIRPAAGKIDSPGYFNGLCWGEYTLTATSDLGCQLHQEIQIKEDPTAPFNMFDYVTIYPNPGDDIIYFKSDYLFEYEVSLISLTGQCLRKKDVYSTNGQLSTASLAPGVYILRFKSQIDNADKKIIIVH